jgi:hypothetical protein
MTSKFRFAPVIRVFTLLGSCIDYKYDYQEELARAIEFKHNINPSSIKEASFMCSDFQGKAEMMEKKDLDFENAPNLEDGEIVMIEGKQYKTTYLGDYSDPIYFEPV